MPDNQCESKLDKILDYAKENKSQATYALRILGRCAQIISLGLAFGITLGTAWFCYDFFTNKFDVYHESDNK